jgi:hypothetical protein
VAEPLILRKLSSNRNRCEEDDVVAKTAVGTKAFQCFIFEPLKATRCETWHLYTLKKISIFLIELVCMKFLVVRQDASVLLGCDESHIPFL